MVIGVSEGREHRADRNAWVARSVDGVSVVAALPSIAFGWFLPRGCQVSEQTWRIDPPP
jgi:hypothetical protein